MSLRSLGCGLAIVIAAAAGGSAQQAAPPSLADVARQAEAAKATVKKAKKSYTNADLSADMRGEPAPATSSRSTGFVSSTLGKPVAAEEIIARSEEKLEQDAVKGQSEERWRQRAASLRKQIDQTQAQLTAMSMPNEARDNNPAVKARHEGDRAKVQQGLAYLRKQWEGLEEEARVAKAQLHWLEPKPQFQQ